MQITISGDIGSGKSTVGKYLAEVYNAELIDCGQLYRSYASKVSKDVLQLNQSGDNSIDIQIDNDLIRMGKEDKNRVYISRTAWHFIPNAVHIYIMVDPMIASKRILNRKTVAEKHDSLDSILEYNRTRIAEEDARYERMYGITREQQLADADIIFHIGNRSEDEVCSAMKTVVSKAKKMFCFDPTIVVPTQVLHDISPEIVNEFRRVMVSNVVGADTKIKLANGIPYIIDGHHRIAAACLNNVKFVWTSDYSLDDSSICILSNSDYYNWEDYVHGDMSAVTSKMKSPADKFISAVSKM